MAGDQGGDAGSASARDAQDAADLARLGYAQQLLREMGGFSNFALSFSIISVLTGAVTLYGHGLAWGGPIVMSVGWPLVTVMTLFVAASLAELASAYPTAGALYHWSAILGGKGAGFFTAWLNTIGQFAITAGIDYGLAEMILAVYGIEDRSLVLQIYALILVSHGLLNHVGVKAVAVLNTFSAWYHVAGVLVLVTALAFLAPKQPASFLWTHHVSTNDSWGYAFMIGLLQAQWTFTGYDASAHVTEETKDPRRNAPWGIVLSVLVSGIAGYVMLLFVTLAIKNLDTVAGLGGWAFVRVLLDALGQRVGVALMWMIFGAIWFCGLGSVTSNSRMLFAFARDGGLPASKALARVSPRFRTPAVAVWTSVVMAFVVALWADAYQAMVALSTIALYASYGLPILVGLQARRSGRWRERGPWHLGRWSTAVNVVALGWIFVITVLFVLPPNQLAGYTFAGCIALIGVYWLSWMRRRFDGPKLGAPTSRGSDAPQ